VEARVQSRAAEENMATVEYWIQLENRPWDACPHNVDRMSGQDIQTITGKAPESVTLTSPGTGVTHTRTMFAPLRDGDGNVMDALILRRYKPPQKQDGSDAWTVPDDRKVNPWDLNELDPSDNGTMGTIPGAVIECNVGDVVLVHFRNLDQRSRTVTTTQEICIDLFGQKVCFPFPVKTQQPIEIERRVHSLHPHGFVFKNTSDGAFPLSPPDASQPIPAGETAAWAGVPGFSGTLKQGDRVPPGGTFTYRWETFGWPTTAGAWLYHDHSICDMENVERGAIGIIVIHNPADVDNDVDIRDPADPAGFDTTLLPGGSPIGSPISTVCFPLPGDIHVLPGDLAGLGLRDVVTPPHGGGGGMPMGGGTGMPMARKAAPPAAGHVSHDVDIVAAHAIRRGDLLFELDNKLERITRFCISRYRTPPAKGLYLQLFHSVAGAPGMCINGRTFLGNTPTIVTGPATKMRFGVVGMGSEAHTFHIHGHRWIIPGPDGNTPPAIQGSAQIRPVSQFEDTRVFGPANSFAFTIGGQPGSFMRAGGPGPTDSLGEWHMHCHVLAHMMTGMMGSLFIVGGGELALPLPKGVPCPPEGSAPPPPKEVDAVNDAGAPTGFSFSPGTVTVNKNDTVIFKNISGDIHSIVWDTAGSPANSPTINTGGATWPAVMTTAGTFNYHCGIHGAQMKGTIIVNP
jgi:FtsP/CotA-like multicopper oxidase with cupredoxin domain/plastocyanin